MGFKITVTLTSWNHNNVIVTCLCDGYTTNEKVQPKKNWCQESCKIQTVICTEYELYNNHIIIIFDIFLITKQSEFRWKNPLSFGSHKSGMLVVRVQCWQNLVTSYKIFNNNYQILLPAKLKTTLNTYFH